MPIRKNTRNDNKNTQNSKKEIHEKIIYILLFYLLILSGVIIYNNITYINTANETNAILKTLTRQHDADLMEELRKQLEKQLEQNNKKQSIDKNIRGARVNTQINCLAQNMYHEARGEPEEGIKAIGLVTLNRVHHDQFPKTVCGVVNQKTTVTRENQTKVVCQFSWKCDDTIDGIHDKNTWKKIYSLASLLYMNYNNIDDVTDGALYFHNTSVTPKWNNLIKTAKIENHVFYKER